jgi:hypothetical protein
MAESYMPGYTKRLYLLLIKKIDIKRRKAPKIFFKSIAIVGLPIKPK